MRSIVAVLSLLATASSVHSADTTLYYPNEEEAVFSVVVPGNWEITPGDDDDANVTLDSPNGVTLQMQAFEVEDGEDITEYTNELIDAQVDYWNANYDDLKLEDPVALTGDFPGMRWVGTGVAKETSDQWAFVYSIINLGNGHVAEIWFVYDPEDTKGLKQGNAILDSCQIYN